MSPTRSARRSTSARLCVEITIARPWRRRSTRRSLTVREVFGSRFAVGSSSRMTCGSCTSARASASFCFIPFERSATRSPRRSHSSKSRSTRSTARPGARHAEQPRVDAAGCRRRSGCPRDPASRSGSRCARAARRRWRGVNAVPVDGDRPRRRGDQPAEHPQRRRLAGAVGAEQPEDLAALDRERDVVDRDAARRIDG